MQLFYIMDPMCSWCWAFSPSIDLLRKTYPQLPITYLLGGLAQDSDTPMPVEQQAYIRSIWETIEQKTGANFNYNFWSECSPRRSTWPACRAVIAAEQLRQGSAENMAKAIQHAYYLNAQNPSDIETLTALASQQAFDEQTFSEALNSDETHRLLAQHRAISQQMEANGFPALRLTYDNKLYRVTDGYMDAESTMQKLASLMKQLNIA